MTKSDDLVFKGADGTECERFIRAVKIQARGQNKLRDERWILELVEVSLEGNALRWFAKLDPVVRSNWDLLHEALLDRFPASDSGEASSTIPTPAATIGTSSIPKPDSGFLRASLWGTALSGRIRIISEVPSVGRYVSASFSSGIKTLAVTDDPRQALQIRFTPSHEPFAIQMLNSETQYDWLAVATDWHIAKNELRFGQITASSHPGLKPVQAHLHAGDLAQSTIWTLMFDGTLIPTWEDDGKTYCLAAAVNATQNRILTVKDLSKTVAHFKPSDSYCQVRLVFEPGV